MGLPNTDHYRKQKASKRIHKQLNIFAEIISDNPPSIQSSGRCFNTTGESRMTAERACLQKIYDVYGTYLNDVIDARVFGDFVLLIDILINQDSSS
jgi:hypothetical protein